MKQNTKTSENVGHAEIIKRLKTFFSMCNDVVFVFLFGSFAKGKATPCSDLDLAIFFSNNYDFYRINDLKDKLSEMLNIAVDIVILNRASPIIKMQALRKGILLVNKTPRIYHEFFVNTVAGYDDLKRVRKEVEENILKGKIYA